MRLYENDSLEQVLMTPCDRYMAGQLMTGLGIIIQGTPGDRVEPGYILLDKNNSLSWSPHAKFRGEYKEVGATEMSDVFASAIIQWVSAFDDPNDESKEVKMSDAMHVMTQLRTTFISLNYRLDNDPGLREKLNLTDDRLLNFVEYLGVERGLRLGKPVSMLFDISWTMRQRSQDYGQ